MHETGLRQLSGLMGIVEGATFDGILHVQGTALDTTEVAASLLLTEMFPDSASETAQTGLISAWERLLSIVPSSGQSIADRRLVVCAKYRAVGGLGKSYFEGTAEGRGYKIGTHVGVGDPHLRVADGEFVPFRADYGRADIDAVYDQGAGANMFTWRVFGTSVESDAALIALFQDLKPAWSELVFVNE